MFKQSVHLVLAVVILLSSGQGPVMAEPLMALPPPGQMLPLSPGFEPLLMKGLKLDFQNPLRLDFILDPGSQKVPSPDALQNETRKLVKYFLAALTVPEKDLWVNLSPYEKHRLLADNFGQTEMGRDMLAQDYLLKQLSASLVYPEQTLGKRFWERVYDQAHGSPGGAPQLSVNTFHKIWIVPEHADVVEQKDSAYVTAARLKVLMEEDDLALQRQQPKRASHSSSVSSQWIRKLILPEIEREINEGQTFAPLRQMYYSMILASWYKQALKNGILTQTYGNQGKTAGAVAAEDQADKDKIFDRYMQAYKQGVFNYIKEDQGSKGPALPQKYFSGGTAFETLASPQVLRRHPFSQPWSNVMPNQAMAARVELSPTQPAERGPQTWKNPRGLYGQKIPADFTKEIAHAYKFLVENKALRQTPLYEMRDFNKFSGHRVFFKDESEQISGSFKRYGVYYQVLSAFHERLEFVRANPEAANQPYYFATQTVGNHGLAMVESLHDIVRGFVSEMANKPGLSAQEQVLLNAVKNMAPRIFVGRDILPVKLVNLRAVIAQFNQGRLDGLPTAQIVTADSYAAAKAERSKFTSTTDGAVYMNHGGRRIMAGHASAGIMIDQQLMEMGIDRTVPAVLLIPVGEGGPTGIAAGLKFNGRPVVAIFVQAKGLDSMIQSLKAGQLVFNDPSKMPFIDIGGKKYVYGDGNAVDIADHDAFELSKLIMGAGIVVEEQQAFDEAAPMLYSDLQKIKPHPVVGGTTAEVAQGFLELVRREAELIPQNAVIILFGSEGSVAPEITKATREKASQLRDRIRRKRSVETSAAMDQSFREQMAHLADRVTFIDPPLSAKLTKLERPLAKGVYLAYSALPKKAQERLNRYNDSTLKLLGQSRQPPKYPKPDLFSDSRNTPKSVVTIANNAKSLEELRLRIIHAAYASQDHSLFLVSGGGVTQKAKGWLKSKGLSLDWPLSSVETIRTAQQLRETGLIPAETKFYVAFDPNKDSIEDLQRKFEAGDIAGVTTQPLFVPGAADQLKRAQEYIKSRNPRAEIYVGVPIIPSQYSLRFWWETLLNINWRKYPALVGLDQAYRTNKQRSVQFSTEWTKSYVQWIASEFPDVDLHIMTMGGNKQLKQVVEWLRFGAASSAMRSENRQGNVRQAPGGIDLSQAMAGFRKRPDAVSSELRQPGKEGVIRRDFDGLNFEIRRIEPVPLPQFLGINLKNTNSFEEVI